MVMLLGQYSTGKTTFIKHLLKCEYPGLSNWLHVSLVIYRFIMTILMCFMSAMLLLTGAHIGPEPTTDRFVVVMVLYIFQQATGVS